MEYIGQKKKGLPHGKGKYIFNNSKYILSIEGQFKNGKFTGKNNTIYYTNLCKYIGETCDFFRNGFGTIYDNNNVVICECNWIKNKATIVCDNISEHIVGTISYNSLGVYTGDLLNNIPDGIGELIYTNGEIYVGSWENGHKSGNGKYVKKMWTYLGNFKNDLMHGFSTIAFKHNNIRNIQFIQCNWIDGHIDTIFESKIGYLDYTSYSGQINDKFDKHGHGTLEIDMVKLECEWKYDKLDLTQKTPFLIDTHGKKKYCGNVVKIGVNYFLNGYGVMTYEDENDERKEYHGLFENGYRHGKGKEIYRSGYIMEGNYTKDKRNGLFILSYILNDTKIQLKLNYSEGNLIGRIYGTHKKRNYEFIKIDIDTLSGFGSYVSKNGNIYNGFINKMNKHNIGTLKKKDYSISCEWKDDMPIGKINITHSNGYTYKFDSNTPNFGKIICGNYRYIGGIKEFKKHGHGVIVYNTGLKISGNWENDLMNGLFYIRDKSDILKKLEYRNGVFIFQYRDIPI